MKIQDAMYRAVGLGETENVRKLVARDPKILEVYVDNNNWLYWASQEGNTEVMEILVKAGLHIDQLNRDQDRTPLEAAAAQGHYEACKWLLDRRANINYFLGKAATPIFSAIYSKSLKLVELFVERGADLRATFGPHPQIDVIRFAQEHGTPEIVSYLEKQLKHPES